MTHVIYNNRIYETKASLAKAYGLNYAQLEFRMNHHTPLEEKVIHKGIPLKFNGMMYNSKKELIDELHISYPTLEHWLKMGKIEIEYLR